MTPEIASANACGRLCRIRTGLLVTCLLLFGMSAGCAPRNAPLLTESSIKYRPTQIAKDVMARPGSFAWSSDSASLAVITGETVAIYIVATNEQRILRLAGAHFVTWPSPGRLLVLARDNESDILFTIDGESLTLARTILQKHTDAIYSTADNSEMCLLSADVRSFSFGTQVALELSLITAGDTTSRPLYSSTRILPPHWSDKRTLLAWTHAGQNPLDSSLLVIEHIKPPAFAPYSRVIMIDPANADILELAGQSREGRYLSASWSPDGRKIALTREDSRIEIFALDGNIAYHEPLPLGVYPSWSPLGDTLYIGGNLISSDGKNRVTLLTHGAGSISAWSPDGTKLAVATGPDLWLFSDISPSSGQKASPLARDLRKKILLLQNLLREGLITPQDYKERKAGILKQEVKQ